LNYKKLAAAVAATALVVGALLGGAGSASAASGDAYQPEFASIDPNSQILYVLNDKAGNDATGVATEIPPEKQTANHEGWKWCTSLSDTNCDFKNSTLAIQGNAVLQNCANTVSDFCLESLELAAPNSDFKPATFVREANQPVWAPDKALGFPGGSGPSLYTSADAPTAGGQNTYAVRVTLKISFNRSTGKFDTNALAAAVVPYRTVNDPNVFGLAGSGTGLGQVCGWIEPGVCGVTQDWVPGTKARISVKVPSNLAGWFKGRIQSPQISINAVNASTNRLVVEAEPAVVPQMAIAKPLSYWEEQRQLGNDIGWWGGPGFKETGTGSGDPGVDKFIDRFRTELKDTATGLSSMWNFATVNAGNGSQCLQDSSRVLGIVTTNAMGYDGSSPSFENGMLSYHVSGLHYAPDGKTLNEGTYDLVMRSDAARCLYGFTKAPISATVSVISASGDLKTAVTTVNEKDGWLTMRAYGFTFSNPVVNVKITQAKDPSASSTSSGSSTGSSTITCVKGKLTKKVSGTAPKCPAGYKKK